MPLNTRQNPANLADIIFTLCVNFLMYVVLILAFYMLVRFYLEEELEYDENQSNYEIVTKSSAKSDELSDLKPVNNGNVSANISGNLELKSMNSKIEENENNVNEVESTGKGMLKMPMKTAASKSKLRSESMSESEADEGPRSASEHSSENSGSFLNLNEWGEPEGTKEEVVQRAIFCAIGLNITFCIWGVLQERMLTMPYDGVFFEYSYGLVFMSRLGGLILSAMLIYHYKVVLIKSPLWEYSFPSVANMLSSWCQYEALKYVSFPTQMLAKAFKMVPTMLMGTFMHNRVYETFEYVSAALVAFGLYLFLDSSETIDFKANVFGDPESVKDAWCGIILLGLFLAFDSFTGQWQSRMFQLHKQMSPIQMMLVMNGFSSVFSFITLVHQEELSVSLRFVYDHPSFFFHLILFTLTANIGQLFIFYTVKNFGAVVFSIIMSLRILLSTLLSCVLYSHDITELGVVGISIVFGALVYRIHRKTRGRPLIRWREKRRSAPLTRKVFSEWHEHLDDC